MSKNAHSIYPTKVSECVFSRTYIANLSKIGDIRNDVLSLNEYQSLTDEEQRDSLMIIITEMITNAIKHGSKDLPDAMVHLGITFSHDSIICIIEDSGHGFDRSSIPDPTLPEYIHREHGRGIYITEHLANAVQYIHTDNTMRIIIQL